MKTLQYEGCTLDVFEGVDSAELDYAKEASLSGLIKVAKEQGSVQYIRRTIIGRTVTASSISGKGLDHYLGKVDEAFASAAKSIGATVIEHQWGLVPRKSAYRGNYCPSHLENFGIKDYLLAAKVPIVSGVSMLNLDPQHYSKVFVKLAHAKDKFVQEHGWVAYDAYTPTQFTLLPKADGNAQIMLHDIDPLTINSNAWF